MRNDVRNVEGDLSKLASDDAKNIMKSVNNLEKRAEASVDWVSKYGVTGSENMADRFGEASERIAGLAGDGADPS